jgi:hypothetical protein
VAETYDSVIDRIGAFNLATEALAKGRAQSVVISVVGRTGCAIRLVKSEENYAIEVKGVPDSADGAIAEMGFRREGESHLRTVRKSERSWAVASQLEDVLQDALGLGGSVAISVETVV